MSEQEEVEKVEEEVPKRPRGRPRLSDKEKRQRALRRLKIFFTDDQLEAELEQKVSAAKDAAADGGDTADDGEDETDKSECEQAYRLLRRARQRHYRSDLDVQERYRANASRLKRDYRARLVAAAEYDERAREKLAEIRSKQSARRKLRIQNPAVREKERMQSMLKHASKKLSREDKEELERTLSRQCTNPLPSEPNIFGYEPLL
ncbi:hypothetical protein TYRP_018416 [Tyrophagus putrescentiae]|nr:hypothetical protein TYRP_018416 [Tyrophagus putrescentiae]